MDASVWRQKKSHTLPLSDRPLNSRTPTAVSSPHPHTCNQLGCKPFRKLDRTSSPRGIDALPHHCVACRKAECDNRPLPPDKVKRNLHFPEISGPNSELEIR